MRAKSNADCHLLRTLSRLTQVQDPTGTYGFTYDNMNRLTQTSTAYSFLPSRTFTVQYGYDAASNRASMTDPENGTTHYNYDTLNRLSSLNDFQSHNFTFSYDALSRRTQLTRPNGINTNYSYDNISHLLSVLHQLNSSTVDGAPLPRTQRWASERQRSASWS